MTQKIEACLICGEPLVYYETAREMTCVYCGRSFPSNAACEAGHFVCDACHSRKAVENILARAAEQLEARLLAGGPGERRETP